jgi:hypothetical protein
MSAAASAVTSVSRVVGATPVTIPVQSVRMEARLGVVAVRLVRHGRLMGHASARLGLRLIVRECACPAMRPARPVSTIRLKGAQRVTRMRSCRRGRLLAHATALRGTSAPPHRHA